MADTAVMSPSASLSRDQTEDVEMADSPAIAASDAQENDESSTSKETAATSNGPPAAPERSRPRINLSTITDVPAAAGSRKASATGERRKGKSIFGLVVGTLNRAKVEDKARMASEKAKKRQEIDARLQAKLAREQTIVRKQDESRKDQIAAKRKLEDMAIKDSIIKNRASVLPDLSNYLLTSDIIPLDVEMDSPDSTTDSTKNITVYPTTSHPPALFFLPKILTPAQEAFLAKRKRRAQELVDADKAEWDAERQKGLDDVRELKEAAENAKAEVQAEKSKEGEAAAAHGTERGPPGASASEDVVVESAAVAAPEVSAPEPQEPAVAAAAPSPPPAEATAPAESEPQAMEGVDEDAVEY